jgi:hypothetical protein
MQFDVRAIDMPQLTCGSRCDYRKHPGEEPVSTPSTKPRVDRAPRAKLLRQVAPRYTRSQDVEYRGEHEPVIFRRSPAQRPPAGFITRAVNFLSLRHNGSGSSLRRISFMRQVGLIRSVFVPTILRTTDSRPPEQWETTHRLESRTAASHTARSLLAENKLCGGLRWLLNDRLKQV